MALDLHFRLACRGVPNADVSIRSTGNEPFPVTRERERRNYFLMARILKARLAGDGVPKMDHRSATSKQRLFVGGEQDNVRVRLGKR